MDSFLKGAKSGALNGLLMAALFIPLGVLIGTFASPFAGGVFAAEAAIMLAKTALVMMIATSLFSGITNYRRDLSEEQTSVTTSITRRRDYGDMGAERSADLELEDNQQENTKSKNWLDFVGAGKSRPELFTEAVQTSSGTRQI